MTGSPDPVEENDRPDDDGVMNVSLPYLSPPSRTDLSDIGASSSTSMQTNSMSTPLASTPVAASTQPSTSGMQINVPALEKATTYSHFQHSPFKKYLKIDDSVIITRKVTKIVSKTPPAISGRDYCDHLQRTQEKKRRELELKEIRKQEREAKRAERVEKMLRKLSRAIRQKVPTWMIMRLYMLTRVTMN
jgi:hypothetical protein